MSTPYDLNLPCLNPSCHSYGRPHPNCKCYGNMMAEGGIAHQCRTKDMSAHDHGCSFSEGGGPVVAESAAAPPLLDNGFEELPPDIDRSPPDPISGPDFQEPNIPKPRPTPMPSEESEEEKEPKEDMPKAGIDEELDYLKDNGKNPLTDALKVMKKHQEMGGDEPLSEPSADAALGDAMGVLNKHQNIDYDEMPAPADSVTEEIKTGLEGFSQGMFSDLAKVAEVKSGLQTLSQMQGREMTYPLIHDYAKLGGRVAAWVGGPTEKFATYVGSRILGNILMGFAFPAGDNIAKTMLGQPGGDPKEAVAATLIHGGIDGLMNVATDGLFTAGGKAFQNSPELAQKAMQWFAKNPLANTIELSALTGLNHAIGSHEIPSWIMGEGAFILGYKGMKKAMGPLVGKVLGSGFEKAEQFASNALLFAMAKTQFFGIPAALRFGIRATEGAGSLRVPLTSLLKTGESNVTEPAKDSLTEKVMNWMEDGGIVGEAHQHHFGQGGGNMRYREIPERQLNPEEMRSKQLYAKGGKVEEAPQAPPPEADHFANLYPAENMMLHAARTRVSNYLNSLRPGAQVKAAMFDSETPNKEKERSYKQAVELAANPLGILNDVNKGTLTPEKMRHFTSMYPEIHDFVSKKMTERLLEAQMNKEKPTYAKRQAMSLFLGTELDSTMSPQTIATTQALFAANHAQQPQPMQKPKKGTAALSKASQAHQTDDQAREQRQQASKE